ncbi:FAD-binding oxidoreductase [Roseovarius sp. EL26]|uniref:FAD-binding oxidoreductase n=1 Tax=Roseovarius sp. EL26 TaxID=2126672 RepID=UPI000EA19AB9|nr:FAD-linked oxidase C-terminal domain-containing protein [Roseovarius sp. EL26]
MELQAAIVELTSLLGQRLSLSTSDLDIHGRSETHFPLSPPDAVAYPATTDEVAQITRICARHHCPIVAWGVGTSLEGQTQIISGGVCVDFSQMNAILAVHPENMSVTIQPGVTREALNEELRATGLFFPVDPGANATLGGMASTRASGTTAVRYGTMRDNVQALEVVTANGEIIRTGTKARKSSSGYDLTALFVGAEGTLGLITELTLRLHGQPEAISGAVCAFPTVLDAVNAVTETIQMGLPMARIELMDTYSVRAVNAYSQMNLPEQPHLLVEFHGSNSAVDEQATLFGDIAADHSGAGFQWAKQEEDRRALWAMRHSAYHAILATRPGAQALVTDVCVPISRLSETINAARHDLAELGYETAPILGHVGDGNFHATLLFDEGDTDAQERAVKASHRLVERALEFDGTATGEHGIGLGKQKYMAQEHGAAWGVMGMIKQTLDPKNIMNPGKLVPSRN